MKCVQQLRLLNKNTKALSAHHSPNDHFPNFSVCSCWACFQLSWEAAAMASPFAQNTAGLPRRARHREQTGSPRKAISIHMTSAPSQVWPHCMRSGARGNNTPSTCTLIFWKRWKSLGREKWEKVKCLSLHLDKRPLSPGTSREAGGVPCLNPRRGLTLLSPVCRDPAIGV